MKGHSSVNGTGQNGGTTERNSFECGTSLTDSCVNEENRAIKHRTVEKEVNLETGLNEDCCSKQINDRQCQIKALYCLCDTYKMLML